MHSNSAQLKVINWNVSKIANDAVLPVLLNAIKLSSGYYLTIQDYIIINKIKYLPVWNSWI